MIRQDERPDVLVVHSGGLGDLVLLSELIASLKQAQPAGTVTLICRSEFTALLDCYPVPPDEVIGAPFQPYRWGQPTEELQALLQPILSKLAGRRITALVDAALRPSWLPEFLAAALHPARSIRCGVGVCPAGMLITLLDWFSLKRCLFHNVDLQAGTHERDRYRLLAEALDSPFTPAVPWSPPERWEQPAQDWLLRNGLERSRYLVCAPLGAMSTPIKRWPMKYFAGVLRRFFRESQWPVLLMGDQSEDDSLAEMESLLLDIPTARFAGRPEELPLAAALLSRAGAYLSNDAGLMHLAQAFEVPGAAIFGGGGEWPAYAPWARGSVGLCNPLPCFGCRWDCFLGHALCVETVPVEKVLEALCMVCRVPAQRPGNLLLQTIGEPLLGLLADSSARYRESEQKLSERLEVILELDRSRRQYADREQDLFSRLAEAESRAKEMETVAAERLTLLQGVHEEAATRLNLIHEISRQAEARSETIEQLSAALARSEVARKQLEQALAAELPSES